MQNEIKWFINKSHSYVVVFAFISLGVSKYILTKRKDTMSIIDIGTFYESLEIISTSIV